MLFYNHTMTKQYCLTSYYRYQWRWTHQVYKIFWRPRSLWMRPCQQFQKTPKIVSWSYDGWVGVLIIYTYEKNRNLSYITQENMMIPSTTWRYFFEILHNIGWSYIICSRISTWTQNRNLGQTYTTRRNRQK